MSRVFLSHSHADKDFVRLVWGDLVACGVDVWIDEDAMEPGDSLTGSIGEALGNVEYVAVFLSEESVKSKWVETEIDIAMARSIASGAVEVVPLLLPGLCRSSIPTLLCHLNFVDLRDPADYDSGIAAVVRRMRSGGSAGDASCLPVRARRRERLVAVAKNPGTADWGISYLVDKVARPDPTERYWVYIALAQVGGPEAETAVREGLSDPDAFARSGAQEAWQILEQVLSAADGAY